MNWTRSEQDRLYLVELFPNCFSPKGKSKRPLAIGILSDLAAAVPELSKTRIRQALRNYTSGATYQRNLRSGAERINLAGEPVGVVAEHESKHARMQMETMKRIARKRRKALHAIVVASGVWETSHGI